MQGYGNLFNDITIIEQGLLYKFMGGELNYRRYINILKQVENDLKLHENDIIPFTYNDIKRVYDCLSCDLEELEIVNKLLTKVSRAIISKKAEDKLKALARIKLECKYRLDYEKVKRLLPAFLIVITSLENNDNIEVKRELIFSCTLIELMLDLMEGLTPRQVEQLFPIDKEYNGKKWCMKDYYSCKEELSNMNIDKPMTRKEAQYYIMECNTNIFITEMGVDIMSIASDYNNWDIYDIMNLLSSLSSDKKSNLKVIK